MMGIAVATLSLQTAYPQSETKMILDEAFHQERDFAYTRFKRFDEECRTFEKEYGMGSAQFLQQFESGELGDDECWFDWYAAIRGQKTWEKNIGFYVTSHGTNKRIFYTLTRSYST